MPYMSTIDAAIQLRRGSSDAGRWMSRRRWHRDHAVPAVAFLLGAVALALVADRQSQDARRCACQTPSRRFANTHHTYLSRRFDRDGIQRLHFSSAMTQLGQTDGHVYPTVGYMDMASFLARSPARTALAIPYDGVSVDLDLDLVAAVRSWREVATRLGVPRSECEDMARAFRAAE
jgi:hypothetical protein